MCNNEICIIIADDHEIVRTGVHFLLQNEPYITIQKEVSSCTELLKSLENEHYNFLILDLNLGDSNGLDTVYEITNRFPNLPILVLSMHDENPYALQSIQAGAKGYLNKRMVSNKLIYAIKTILENNIYLDDEYKTNLPYGALLHSINPPPIETLSKREYEVYKLITQGIRSIDIANKLGLSPKTVSTYRARILEKLSLHNINQLIQYAMHHTYL